MVTVGQRNAMDKSELFDKLMVQRGLSATYMKSESYNKIKQTFIDKPEIIFAEFLNDEFKRGEELLEALKKQRTSDVRLIKNTDTVDSVIAFKTVLNAVKETLGEENMTEAVMCKAIEAGSYIGYRSIMGQAADVTTRKL